MARTKKDHAEPVDLTDQDNPLGALRFRAREIVRDLIRGKHDGQRQMLAAQKAEQMPAPGHLCIEIEILLANAPSTDAPEQTPAASGIEVADATRARRAKRARPSLPPFLARQHVGRRRRDAQRSECRSLTAGWTFALADPALGDLRVAGYTPADAEALIKLLPSSLNLEVRRAGARQVIVSRHALADD